MATTRTAEPIVFLWQGRDKRGTKLKGQQIATNPNLVRAELRRQGINPISVKRKPKPLFGGAGSRISAKDIAVFSRQLATMLKSGVPLVMSLQIISGGLRNPRMQTVVDKIRAEVESGSSLHEALGEFPVGCVMPQPLKFVQIANPAITNRFGDQARQTRVCHLQPASRCDSVGRAAESPRKKLIKITK